MSSSHQKKAQIYKTLPCPECGESELHYVTEDVQLNDGAIIPELHYLKCRSCKSKFFDDDAIHKIQSIRKKTTVSS